ncbi:MAG TPA: L-glutamate gamma-semialdehyde dehydrogenase [Polyangia bacterium]|nr:L-glutamate gamma-semialdehyde dehydrogenase [Polyangia bacterium]
MLNAIPTVPAPVNEPVYSYAPGTPERALLKRALESMAKNPIEIPLYVGGRELRTGKTADCRAPHRHQLKLATVHQAGPEEVAAALEAARAAAGAWARTPWYERLAVFLRAAELLATRYRPLLNAATMLGQSKTAHQAEIDAACESIDFWRWNAHFAERIYKEQPYSPPGMWNQLDARPLEGFVLAVTPFNFTSIGANLPTAPAMMGNVVVWKPARTATLSAWWIMQILREAGLPDGVINFVPGPAEAVSQVALPHAELAGIHFTGSTGVFQKMWRTVGENITRYRSYPRLVGETGGKDFIVAHPSADASALAVAVARGGYEYQGQKCSAASRVYVPESLWRGGLRDRLLALIGEIRMGDVADFRNFMGAVIDKASFENISGYLRAAKQGPNMKVLAGGELRGEEGWFVAPTLVESEDPKSRLMSEEIFGPVVTLHVYKDASWDDTLRMVDETSPYALTGAVFARERGVIEQAAQRLRHAAGNFYINDKPTGAVVGQQPFGGARASGTNDKAGSLWNLIRWVSPRTIKENFAPPVELKYPFMAEA